MNMPSEFIRQHLIDPELCIRCNTCEESCTRGAILHDINNYVVIADKCNACMDCVANCPTGAVNNWHIVPAARIYTLEEQYGWTSLPTQDPVFAEAIVPGTESTPAPLVGGAPASAPKPVVNLYHAQHPAIGTVVENRRLTAEGCASDVRHITIDFGGTPYPVLEGQSVGIIPPGTDESGKPYQMRLYSVANARDGEIPGTNRVALTVKRVTEDREGRPFRGVCSNYLCDLAPGATVRAVGPFGTTYLMPDDPDASLIMICTGTGVAPMRAMIERRRRVNGGSGTMILFFGGRTPDELPYRDDLQGLPGHLVAVNLAYSRLAGRPKQYVQDSIRTHSECLRPLLTDERCYVYLCGLKGMEGGVLEALRDACDGSGLTWEAVAETMKAQGRLHIETY